MATEDVLRVAVTGAAGRKCYPMLYMIGCGMVFGEDKQIIFQLLDLPEKSNLVEGVAIEVLDCALPPLRDVICTTDPAEAFKDVDVALLTAGMPIGPGGYTSNSQSLEANVKIYKEHGMAIDKYAKKTVKVLVIGNPCNTLALVCMTYAPSIPSPNFSGMSMLAVNRTIAQLAQKMSVPCSSVKNVLAWGNTSALQFPDCSFAVVTYGNDSKRVEDVINNAMYTRCNLVEKIQKRSKEIFKLRGQTPILSTAKAACDQMSIWWNGTRPGGFCSMAVLSDGSYGVPKGIFFSFPVEICNKEWRIIHNLPLEDYIRTHIERNIEELLVEKNRAFKVLNQIGDAKAK